MDADRNELAALSFLGYLGRFRETLSTYGYVEFSGSLADAYHDAYRDLYLESSFDRSSAALLRATELAAADAEMLAMLGEGPIRSWLETGRSRVLEWAARQASEHPAWREALGSVTLSYQPELDVELRAISRQLRAVWNLPDR
jgi:hypothetical protein